MNREDLVLIWFNINKINFSKFEKFLLKFDKIDDIFDKKLLKNAFFDDEILVSIKERLLELDEFEFEQSISKKLFDYNIVPVTYISKDYPEKLKNIDEPPIVLYTRGNLELLNKKAISIVGTRKPTTYGKIVCEKFTTELASAGLVTVSGLAYGIDTIVAEKTLEAGGSTIAVLAGGLNSIYPTQNKALSEKIVSSGGLLVSEYFVGVLPQNFHFVARNRIVAGLGLGTLIVEAGSKSGTMITSRYAVEQGRELFVVPGNITSAQSAGTNALIDEMPDTFTISPKRILYKLGIKAQEKPKSQVQMDISENKILEELSNGELSFDDLSDKTGISASELSSKLIKLEMFGLIKKGNGNTYFKM